MPGSVRARLAGFFWTVRIRSRPVGANSKPVGFSSPGGVTAKMRMLALEHAASPTGQYAFGF
jgi:hypothetical protein